MLVRKQKKQAYKPGSVFHDWNFYHLSSRDIADMIERPTHPESTTEVVQGSEQLHIQNLFGLSTPGVFHHTCHHAPSWALTSRFHLFPVLHRGSYFLLHFPASLCSESFPLGSRMLYVARTFLFKSIEAIERLALAKLLF